MSKNFSVGRVRGKHRRAASSKSLWRTGHHGLHGLVVLRFESLESRCLLSASTLTATVKLTPQYKLRTLSAAKPLSSVSPVGLTPQQIRSAYGINQITFDGGIVGDGTGQTIAIVDAYHTPTMAADLHSFDVTFGLPDPPIFKQVAQDGSTNFPSVDPAGPGAASGNWELETALDVEWAHAIAPGANILLVEANSDSFADLVQGAVNYARSQPGVVTVSMSFGSDEFSGETSYDSDFTTPTGHGGVTFLAATGDAGQPGGYPAYSPNVIGVGGTTLSTDSAGNYLSETGWSGSGGGISTQENQPAYQSGVVTQSSTKRTNPDVAFDVDPNSGAAVYDSYNFPSAPWIQVGGTSFSTPAWAGLIAIADQGRSLSGLGSLNGRNDALPLLYQLPTSSFHDITSGNNGFTAGAGYDLVTGRGSPKANLVVGGLIGSTISGTVFSDANDNGVLENGESGLADWTVFDDVNNDGVLSPAVQSTVASTDTPIPIPDRKTIVSSITVSGVTGPISDLNVNLTLHHTYDSDLVITLISPTGTQVTLANRDGTSGDNYLGTVFDDQAATSIANGLAPFSGSFQPIGSLAALNGTDPNGVWKLQVADTVRIDSGTLNNWSLQFTSGADQIVTTGADGSFKFVGVTPGVHHIREVPEADFTPTSPAAGVYDITLAVGQSFKTADFGNFQPPPNPPPQATPLKGDFTGDGKLTGDDIHEMFLALADLNAYEQAHSLDDTAMAAIGDFTGDGKMTNGDLQGLLDAVAAAEPPIVQNSSVTSNTTAKADTAEVSTPAVTEVLSSDSKSLPGPLPLNVAVFAPITLTPTLSNHSASTDRSPSAPSSTFAPRLSAALVDAVIRGPTDVRRKLRWLDSGTSSQDPDSDACFLLSARPLARTT